MTDSESPNASRFVALVGYENAWLDDAEVTCIWYEPTYDQIVIDTPGYDGLAGSLDARQARQAAAVLLAFADLWETRTESEAGC